MLFGLLGNKRMNSQTIKREADKTRKRLVRRAKKMAKTGVLPDSHSLAAFLVTVDAEYAHMKADIANMTHLYDYERIRAEKYASTEKDLAFYSVKLAKLQDYAKAVGERASEAGLVSELTRQKLDVISTAKLERKFSQLDRDEEGWTGRAAQAVRHETRRRPIAVSDIRGGR